jgi:PAS domain S-box-containing protein
MFEPINPPDEGKRIEDLRALGLLDTPPEERFDRITRTAQRLFGVATVLLSLVDAKRQWFKSMQGTNDVGNLRESPRSISFCGHAILGAEPLIVEDAALDPRFADNPLVKEAPRIRFYAGMPVHGAQGYRVGALCLYDPVPRVFESADVAALADLAMLVEAEFSAREASLAILHARSNEAGLRAILDNVVDGIINTDERGIIESVNPAVVRIFGFAVDELVGRSINMLMPEHYQREHDNHVRKYTQTRKTKVLGMHRELFGQRKDGMIFPLELAVNEIQMNGRRFFVGIVRDITERKKIEQMKNEFISTVSHELRTPLTSIRGSLGLLVAGAVGEIPRRAQSLLTIANNNCERLVRLINDILDVEKIESGNMRFDLAHQGILPLVEQAIQSTQAFGAQHQVRFVLDPASTDVDVSVDADRLTQVIVNLLSNAAKFSTAGTEVRLSIDRNEDFVRVSVRDQGPGIGKEFQSRIFQKFAQADASDTRKKGGTGLGLSISRAIIEKHRGRIGFVTDEGAGTEFFFELPAVQARPAPVRQEGKVLICEDDPDIASLLGMMLERGGLSNDIAHDTAQARELLSSRDYQAMTLDLALPGEDGMSLLHWMREHDRTSGLPVIVISAKADKEHKQITGGAVGVVDWLTKPIDPARLLESLKGAARNSFDKAPSVLYIEDEPGLVQVVTALLEPGLSVTHSGSIADAIGKLSARRFRLVILDINLPDGKGTDLLTSLPALNASTPVMVFSAEAPNRVLLDRVSRALVKSQTSNERLLATIHDLIGGSGGRKPTEEQ